MKYGWSFLFLLALFSVPLNAAPSTAFAIKLLASEGAFQPKECSPVGLWVALSVLAKSSEGATQRELVQLLDESCSIDSIDHTLSSIKELKALELSLGLFAKEGIYWKESFLNAMKPLYAQIHMSTCPFHRPEEALLQINNWTKEATKGEIPEILHRDDIDEKTVSCLLSALYFSKNWVEPFKKGTSDWSPFYIGNGVRQVRTMHSSESLPYASCSFGQYIEKPLASEQEKGRYVVECFLPHHPLSAQELEQALTLCRAQASRHKVSLSLPQSKGKSFTEWSNWLKKQGVFSLFTDRAAFSRLASIPLAVQQIKEGTTVSLTEAGVIVADVVAVTFRCTACFPEFPSIYLHFNRPFFFLVREKESDTVISCSYIGSFQQLIEQSST